MLIAWIAMKVMSWQLWLADRLFPLVPLVTLPPAFHTILFILFFISALLLFIKPLQLYLLCFLIITETLSLLGDQLRWHPWEYQFLFICLAVLLNRKNLQLGLNSIIFVFASSYFFSGLSKLNGDFLNNIWLRLMVIKILHFPKTVYYNPFIRYSGLIIPVIELLCSILILLPAHFKTKSWLPISVHLFIIIYISPLVLDFDYIVFPWNLFMIAVLYLFFIKNKTVFSFQNLMYKQNIVIACAWIFLPLAGIFGYWPPFFSFKLYTGAPVAMIVYFPDNTEIPSEIRPYIKSSVKGYNGMHNYFLPFNWCDNELMVPIPPERRIYKSLQHSFEERYHTLHPAFRYY